MKHDWEYKKLGEMFQTSSGGTPSKNHNEYYEGGNIPWLRSGEVSQGDIYESEMFITQKGLDNSSAKIFPCNTVVIAMYGATVGQVGILRNEMSTNQAICGIFPSVSYKPEFLKFVLSAQKSNYLKVAVGGAQPNISQQIIKDTLIPNIPLPTQQSIVSELDSLSKIIADCKETLKDYDALEQSIFYDMFGDPVKNEKGWEVKKLGEVFRTSSGGTPSKTKPEYYNNGTIPWLRSGEVAQGNIYNAELSITEMGLDNSSAKIFPANTVVIAMYGATVGQVGILKNPMSTNQAVCGIYPHPDYTVDFVRYFLMGKKKEFIKDAVGGAQPNISQQIIKDVLMPVVPLPLQQQFASKIEAIEQMKTETKKALQETETLFNARMDYWFN